MSQSNSDDVPSSQASNSSQLHSSSQQTDKEEQIRKEKEHHRSLFEKALTKEVETEAAAAAETKK
jgi:hypothetical protein